jgi:hypothetical protein
MGKRDGMGWDGRELTWAVPAHNADTYTLIAELAFEATAEVQ